MEQKYYIVFALLPSDHSVKTYIQIFVKIINPV